MPYLKERLESLFAQDAPEDAFEIILIDDGSTDGSAEVCDETAMRHRTICVRHCENSGSPAILRNIGTDMAKGRYVFFCDADDLLCSGAISGMLFHAKESGCDIGLFKVDRSAWGGNYRGLFDEDRRHVPLTSEPLASFFGSCKLFERSLLIHNDIRFIPGIIPEDRVLFDTDGWPDGRVQCR